MGKGKAGFSLLLHLEEIKCKEILWSVCFVFNVGQTLLQMSTQCKQTLHSAQSSPPLSPMHTPLVPGCHLSVTAGTELIPGHRQPQEQGFSTELRCLMRMGQMLSKGTSVSVVVRTNTTSCKATLISFFILQ